VCNIKQHSRVSSHTAAAVDEQMNSTVTCFSSIRRFDGRIQRKQRDSRVQGSSIVLFVVEWCGREVGSTSFEMQTIAERERTKSRKIKANRRKEIDEGTTCYCVAVYSD
jgi:hypothetical protein